MQDGHFQSQSVLYHCPSHSISQTILSYVQVSLEQKIATIMYDTSMTSPEELRNHIDDMGFDASLPTAGASVKIGVTGMTYQSCASEIESKIGALPGVLSIQVSGHGFL